MLWQAAIALYAFGWQTAGQIRLEECEGLKFYVWDLGNMAMEDSSLPACNLDDVRV